MPEYQTDDMLKSRIAELEAENNRLKQCLRWQDDRDGRIGTHSNECWSFGNKHYECAVRKIKELVAEVKHWKANHDEAVKKLRLFTDRTDLPVYRTRAYNYVLELEDTVKALRHQIERIPNSLSATSCESSGVEVEG